MHFLATIALLVFGGTVFYCDRLRAHLEDIGDGAFGVCWPAPIPGGKLVVLVSCGAA